MFQGDVLRRGCHRGHPGAEGEAAAAPEAVLHHERGNNGGGRGGRRQEEVVGGQGTDGPCPSPVIRIQGDPIGLDTGYCNTMHPACMVHGCKVIPDGYMVNFWWIRVGIRIGNMIGCKVTPLVRPTFAGQTRWTL